MLDWSRVEFLIYLSEAYSYLYSEACRIRIPTFIASSIFISISCIAKPDNWKRKFRLHNCSLLVFLLVCPSLVQFRIYIFISTNEKFRCYELWYKLFCNKIWVFYYMFIFTHILFSPFGWQQFPIIEFWLKVTST